MAGSSEKTQASNVDVEEIAQLLQQQSQSSATQRTVVLHGELTEHQSNTVIQHLLFLAEQDSSAPINFVISTYGGSVDEMFGIYDVMKYVQCRINTVAIGKVMSAGVLLFAAGHKGNRLIGRNARIMVHPASLMMQGSVFQAQNEVAEITRMQSLLFESLLRETKFKRPALQKMMAQGYDQFMSAEDAVKYGIADKIIG